jgi:hypothetical protein
LTSELFSLFFFFILGCISNDCHCCVNLQRVGNKAPCLGCCCVSQRGRSACK